MKLAVEVFFESKYIKHIFRLKICQKRVSNIHLFYLYRNQIMNFLVQMSQSDFGLLPRAKCQATVLKETFGLNKQIISDQDFERSKYCVKH